MKRLIILAICLAAIAVTAAGSSTGGPDETQLSMVKAAFTHEIQISSFSFAGIERPLENTENVTIPAGETEKPLASLENSENVTIRSAIQLLKDLGYQHRGEMYLSGDSLVVKNGWFVMHPGDRLWDAAVHDPLAVEAGGPMTVAVSLERQIVRVIDSPWLKN